MNRQKPCMGANGQEKSFRECPKSQERTKPSWEIFCQFFNNIQLKMAPLRRQKDNGHIYCPKVTTLLVMVPCPCMARDIRRHGVARRRSVFTSRIRKWGTQNTVRSTTTTEERGREWGEGRGEWDSSQISVWFSPPLRGVLSCFIARNKSHKELRSWFDSSTDQFPQKYRDELKRRP